MVKKNQKIKAIVACLLLLAFVLLYAIAEISKRSAITQTQTKMQNTLNFQKENLINNLDKYSVMAVLIARRPDIVDLISRYEYGSDIQNSEELSAIITGLGGSNDIWITDKQGLIISSDDKDFISRNISKQNYFQAAMEGRLGRGFNVSKDKERHYIYAAPVFDQHKVIGAVIVRVDIEVIEQIWALSIDPIILTDESDRVILANVKNWRLRFWYPPDRSENQQSVNKLVVQKFSYPDNAFVTLQQSHDADQNSHYLHLSEEIPLLGWTIHVVSSYSAVTKQRNIALVITVLVLALVLMAFGFWLNRKKLAWAQQRAQQAFSLKLERQVRDRTHELVATNQQMEIEISERKQIEKDLIEAQQDLVHAAKLAGIGQMSTALAHEYNQPLTSIRSYADNAALFIEKNNFAAAADNLERIKMLVHKMADLTKTLKTFAHKDNDKSLEAVSIPAVMDELIILLSPLSKKMQVELKLIPAKETLSVLAVQNRLIQVLTNLITNAFDAASSRDNPLVEIEWYKELNHAKIVIKDTGPGIPEAIRKKMFEPFVSTKAAGNGLGLGLFIASTIIKDFKGSLNLVDKSGYGAVFEILLPLAE